jgi:RNA polymerase sigma-70 factor, ECF subfamily
MTEPSKASDADLLAAIRAGDGEAFACLFRRWQGPLFRFALRMSGSRAAAEDVTQETFMALIGGSGPGFDPARGTVAAYLHGIARNKVRRLLYRERHLLPWLPETGTAGEPLLSDPYAEALHRERMGLVWRALLSLPAVYREALVLCDLQELSYEEASAAIGCPVGTLRSRLNRGRERLARRLGARAISLPATTRVRSAT